MAGVDTTVRRWCEQCQDFTLSRIDTYGVELCARCYPDQPKRLGR